MKIFSKRVFVRLQLGLYFQEYSSYVEKKSFPVLEDLHTQSYSNQTSELFLELFSSPFQLEHFTSQHILGFVINHLLFYLG